MLAYLDDFFCSIHFREFNDYLRSVATVLTYFLRLRAKDVPENYFVKHLLPFQVFLSTKLSLVSLKYDTNTRSLHISSRKKTTVLLQALLCARIILLLTSPLRESFTLIPMNSKQQVDLVTYFLIASLGIGLLSFQPVLFSSSGLFASVVNSFNKLDRINAETLINTNSVLETFTKHSYVVQMVFPAIFIYMLCAPMLTVLIGLAFPQNPLFLRSYVSECDGWLNYGCVSLCYIADGLMALLGFTNLGFMAFTLMPVGIGMAVNLELMAKAPAKTFSQWRHSAFTYRQMQILMEMINEIVIYTVPAIQSLSIVLVVALTIGFIKIDNASLDNLLAKVLHASIPLGACLMFTVSYYLHRYFESLVIQSEAYLKKSDVDLLRLTAGAKKWAWLVKGGGRIPSRKAFKRQTIFVRCNPFFRINGGAAITFVQTVFDNTMNCLLLF